MNTLAKIIHFIISFVTFQKEKYQLISATKQQHAEQFISVKKNAYLDAKIQMDSVLKEYSKTNYLNTTHYQADCRVVMRIYQSKLDDFKKSCKIELQKIRKEKFKIS